MYPKKACAAGTSDDILVGLAAQVCLDGSWAVSADAAHKRFALKRFYDGCGEHIRGILTADNSKPA
jgi:hypothetical protein